MANGDAMPNNVTGMMNRIITEVNDPARTPNWSWSKALAASRRIGRETRGIRLVARAAHARILKKVSDLGERSAQAPPMKYPAVR